MISSHPRTQRIAIPSFETVLFRQQSLRGFHPSSDSRAAQGNLCFVLAFATASLISPAMSGDPFLPSGS
jgi:hypothetical protein